jgi:ribosome maturation factor RimP
MSLEKDIESLVKSLDLELYDTSIVQEGDDTIYRVSVVDTKIEDGKKKGVSLDTCVELTHMISPLLDVTPPVSGDYRLEVGSPGIERKLNNVRQFELSIGDDAKITLKDKSKIKAKITKVQDSKIFLENEDGEISVDFGEISKARTYFEW